MSARALQLGLVLLTMTGVLASVWVGFHRVVQVFEHAPSLPVIRQPSRREPGLPADSLVSEAARRPMFRADRRRAKVAFDPSSVATVTEASSPPVPRPQLSLSGIIWGTEPAAIVEGVPGADGSRVLRRGQEASGIRVVRIERERVILAGADTTWTLQVRDPWR
jgi:hypothetical protein